MTQMTTTLSQPVATVKLPQSRRQCLLEAASQAPSPDNNQPWAFRCLDDRIDVFHCRSRALPSDVKNFFSWLALGAAIENIVLAASTCGLKGIVHYHERPFTMTDGTEHVATIAFEESGDTDPLAQWIDRRVTNRKLYDRAPLQAGQLQPMSASVSNPDYRIVWLTGRRHLKRLAQLVRTADRIRFEHQPFHDEFHNVLRYSEEHAESTGDGLELKTLEVPAIAGPVFRWLRPWKRMRFANRFGLSRMFAGYSAKQIVHSGAVGLLTVPQSPRAAPRGTANDRMYLEGGRALQRVWLAATRENLAFQPLGAVPLFLTKLQFQGPETFLPKHAEQLQTLATEFAKLFLGSRVGGHNSGGEDDFPQNSQPCPLMLFRLGRADPPSARSIRYPVNKILIPAEEGEVPSPRGEGGRRVADSAAG